MFLQSLLARVVVVPALIAATVLATPVPSGAATVPHDAVIWDGGEGGWVGQGVEGVFVEGQPDVTLDVHQATETLVSVTVRSSDPARRMGYARIELAPPVGSRFEPGAYEDAEDLPFRDASKPGIAVSKDHNGCSWDRGRFVVHEATYALLSNTLQTFSATFEHSCDGLWWTVGEVHLNSTRALPGHAGGQQVLGFMSAAVPEPVTRVARLTSVGQDPLTVGGPTITGADAARFAIAADTCSGKTLAPGASCEVAVTFTPTDGSDRWAYLDIADGSSRGRRRWTLSGGVAVGPAAPPPAPAGSVPGYTALYIDRTDSNPGYNKEQVFRPTDPFVQLRVEGGRSGVTVSLANEDGLRTPRSWRLILAPTSGDWFEEGNYLGATRAAFRSGPRPGIDIAADGAACNETSGSFAIHELEFAADGRIARLAASWFHACKGVDVFEAGEIRWNSTVPLTTRQASPGLIDFGEVEVGASAEGSVTVTSTGNAPLHLGAAVTSHPSLQVVDDGCAGQSLLLGLSCSVRVRFAPSQDGTVEGQLRIPDSTVNRGRRFTLRGAGTGSGSPPPTTSQPPPSSEPAPARSGYWMLDASGKTYAFGDAGWFGNAPVGANQAVDLEDTPTGRGQWILDNAGNVHAFGDAGHHGGAGPLRSSEQATSISSTRTGLGYWIFTSAGRVIARGDAVHLGDMAGTRLNGPVLDSIPTASGNGYYMVASDGGIFTFGDARFRGSMGGEAINAPVQSLVPDPDGDGYWLVASDGGIFAFAAAFHGSMGDTRLNRPITGMVGYPNGYLMVAEDGGIFAFGDAPFHGSLGDRPPPHVVTSVAAL